MSYCRWSEYSDVYMFPHTQGGITCFQCRLNSRHDVDGLTRESALEHLRTHIGAGHLVPRYAFDHLIAEELEGLTGQAKRRRRKQLAKYTLEAHNADV